MLDRTDDTSNKRARRDGEPIDARSGSADSHDVLDIASGSSTETGSKRDDAVAKAKRKPDEAKGPRPDEKKDGQGDQKGDGQGSDSTDAESDSKSGFDGGGFWAAIRKHPWAVAISLVILVAAIVAGIIWYLHARHFESTDDAFIDGRPVSVSPEVTGNLVEVPVNDNQIVQPGDLLARIDPRDYVAAVAQAQAQIDQTEATVENYESQIAAQQATVDQNDKQVVEAQAALNFSQDENKRYQELVRTGFGTVQRAQQAGSDLQSKEAALSAAQAALVGAQRQIKVLKSQRENAKAQREQARAQKATADANLTRSELHATLPARVTRLTAAVGQVATQSQALMVLVPLDLWVTANFKETQLTDMRPGQPVDIEIDAFGRTFPGKIDSIQAGSGTAFSLLPAENATGNYVKVVQRVPVKIVFDKRPDVELGPGMSVVPTARVR